MQLVSNHVDAQRYAEALAGLRSLLESDLLERLRPRGGGRYTRASGGAKR